MSYQIYNLEMAEGKALTRLVMYLTVNLVKSGNALLLFLLLLNHVRLFVLAKLGYWEDQDFYSEIRLWNNLVGLITVDSGWIRHYRLEYPEPMDEFLKLVRTKFGIDKPEVLDVGSGPISRLREGTHKFKLYCLDPLAKEYSRILKMSKMKTDYQFVEGVCEELSRIFTKERFHLVYASNSLDHTRNPDMCIKQMFDVLRPYGILCIESYVSEGSHLGWYGLHQHDLMPVYSDLHLRRRKGEPQNITTNLSLRKIHFQRKTEERWFSIAWQKIPDNASR